MSVDVRTAFSVSIGLLIVLVGGAYYLRTASSPSSSELSPAPRQVIVLSDHGFVPDELFIGKGETVTFRAEIERQFWPASNLHPDHSIYPEFDPQRPLQPQEEWSFVFERPGTWRFHDHLRSYYTGTIYVE